MKKNAWEKLKRRGVSACNVFLVLRALHPGSTI